MAAGTAPDLSAFDIDALRAMVLEQHAVIERLLPRLVNQFADRFPTICRVKWKRICPLRKVVRPAVRN